ncbi:MAG TPA: hypothetical protein VFK14_11040 [Solirubrobacterales bacterium]|nr:hypothetical protein [Solirubrobacterales bacterium]
MDRTVESLVVECLSCGTARLARRTVFRRFETPECPKCGYLGWAPRLELTESERAELRAHPVVRRALRIVA